MKRLLIAGALAFAALGQALAADFPEPAPPPPRAPAAYVPTVVPVYNWGGIYLGLNGGFGFGNSQWTNAAVFVPTSTGNFTLSSGVLGGTIGANFQTDAFVFGVEGDFDGSWLDGKTTNAPCLFGACETRNTWLGTLRARIGYAADRVLFYGTAGGAFGSIDSGVTGFAFDKSNKAGWTAGAGAEVALADNWTARIEYLFVDLQNATCNVNCGGVGTTVKFDTSLVRVGVMYKFR